MDNITKARWWIGGYWILGYCLGLAVYFGFLGLMDSWGIIIKEDWNEWAIIISFMIFPQIIAYIYGKSSVKPIIKKYGLGAKNDNALGGLDDGQKGEE